MDTCPKYPSHKRLPLPEDVSQRIKDLWSEQGFTHMHPEQTAPRSKIVNTVLCDGEVANGGVRLAEQLEAACNLGGA